jgi:hypothetical protein
MKSAQAVFACVFCLLGVSLTQFHSLTARKTTLIEIRDSIGVGEVTQAMMRLINRTKEFRIDISLGVTAFTLPLCEMIFAKVKRGVVIRWSLRSTWLSFFCRPTAVFRGLSHLMSMIEAKRRIWSC